MKIRVVAIAVLALTLASSETFAAPLLSVTGQCQKKVQPDRVALVMSARVVEKDASAASKKVTALYETLRKEVRKMNLKDQQLQTDNYSVNPEIDYSNNKRVVRGYNASMGLRVETSELEKIGDLLMLSSRLGIQDVGSPTTFLSPELSQKEYESCLKVAVQSARSKAEKMAAAAGHSVKDLATLNETRDNDGPIPLNGMARFAEAKEMAQDQAAPTVEIAPLVVQVTIYASYNLK